MKLDVNKEVNEAFENAKRYLDQLGIDIKTDEYVIVQQFDDGHGIIISLVEEEERTVKVQVMDTIVALPKKDGLLDVFVNEEDSE